METQDSSVGLRREELYELVWATPVQRLGSELGICDVALRGSTSKGKLPDLISAPSNASRRNDVPETPPEYRDWLTRQRATTTGSTVPEVSGASSNAEHPSSYSDRRRSKNRQIKVRNFRAPSKRRDLNRCLPLRVLTLDP